MQLAVIYHCNEWQEYSSFRLIGVVDYDSEYDSLQDIQKELGYTDEEMEKYIYVQYVDLNELDI